MSDEDEANLQKMRDELDHMMVLDQTQAEVRDLFRDIVQNEEKYLDIPTIFLMLGKLRRSLAILEEGVMIELTEPHYRAMYPSFYKTIDEILQMMRYLQSLEMHLTGQRMYAFK